MGNDACSQLWHIISGICLEGLNQIRNCSGYYTTQMGALCFRLWESEVYEIGNTNTAVVS
jgi:hypothetical protein